jgi:hypothetical protein
VNVDDGLLPLAGLNLALEENVDLSVRSVLHLRKPDVCHDQADESGTSPDITALATEVGALCLLVAVLRSLEMVNLQ